MNYNKNRGRLKQLRDKYINKYDHDEPMYVLN